MARSFLVPFSYVQVAVIKANADEIILGILSEMRFFLEYLKNILE
ncbi:hypothetical protein LBBP_02276 [Leptospira borgpetersenii serovar Ballum]|uniref:Uncharacterized protein n=1 Tax=Leptospira borgpetersenii serovar Ballum TaxID=280505 RepID=A0A0S2IS87_LEPBO|nr:hypothetical protein LBBP_02276 [Leptospira borgpetersenii serovar Ballum]